MLTTFGVYRSGCVCDPADTAGTGAGHRPALSKSKIRFVSSCLRGEDFTAKTVSWLNDHLERGKS